MKNRLDTIIEEFSVSIAVKLVLEDSLQELIDREVYTLLSQHSKDKVVNSIQAIVHYL